MDLLPSSHHDSMEELWDKEEGPEEIENMMKVVPFAYNHFYHHFIKSYSKKIRTLSSFLKKDSCLPLNEEVPSQSHQLKEDFTTAPILSHFIPSLPTIVETNSSDYALGAVLSQVSDSGKHPIAFDSHKHIPADLNY
ncbi:hypothetical protein O181_006737 [Austropuccinia psidii MF-1]|uniref:Reverse transcriptase/retrotransposon-derived protein RNase H-like domain-containing protein n=1 Tax=Austropuccinia psidii MF-1 TaxID=1389203 RepID=A0A9Q3GHV2_9BASI|nr:hypothetical protein [Austropuccinia psidii MF-1]